LLFYIGRDKLPSNAHQQCTCLYCVLCPHLAAKESAKVFSVEHTAIIPKQKTNKKLRIFLERKKWECILNKQVAVSPILQNSQRGM
jgi:hypothetical protein